MNDKESKLLTQVHEAICGNKETGNLGLLERHNRLSKKVWILEKMAWVFSGGIAAWEYFKK